MNLQYPSSHGPSCGMSFYYEPSINKILLRVTMMTGQHKLQIINLLLKH